MGIVTMTMSEVIANAKFYKQEMAKLFYNYLDPESEAAKNSKLFYNLYNNRGFTIKGHPVDEVSKSIKDTYNDIERYPEYYARLQEIKNTVNSICMVEIKDQYYTISNILTLKDSFIRNFLFNKIRKLKDDRQYVENYLENKERVLEIDKTSFILNNIKQAIVENSDPNNVAEIYSALSSKFNEENELKILDPLNIDIYDTEKTLLEFYNTIDFKIIEFNNSVKVWVDLDTDDRKFWGFDTCNYTKLDINSL